MRTAFAAGQSKPAYRKALLARIATAQSRLNARPWDHDAEADFWMALFALERFDEQDG